MLALEIKLKRKIYENELRKLQVQLCRLQDWVKQKGLRVHPRVRGARCGWQGRHHQGNHREGEPTRLSRRVVARLLVGCGGQNS